jgi:hypothetical protein
MAFFSENRPFLGVFKGFLKTFYKKGWGMAGKLIKSSKIMKI